MMIRKTNSHIPLKYMFANKLYNVIASVLIVLMGILIFSCQKKTNTNISFHRGVESAKNYVYAQQMMTQIMATYFKSITDSTLIADGSSNIDGAAVFTFHNESPRRIRFKYPDWSSEDGYGHRRAGLIDATTTGKFDDVEAEINFTFTDFLYDFDSVFVDSLQVQNKGKVDGKNNQYKTKSPYIEYHFADSSGIFTFSLNQDFIVYKFGSTYYTNPKDSLGIYGGLDGNTVRDVTFEAINSADSALLFSYQCNYLKLGIVEIETYLFDYITTAYFQEADSCNNEFLIVVDKNPFPHLIESN